MIDWNGNGKMDPVDVGISVAVDGIKQDDGEQMKSVAEKKKGFVGGCLLFPLSIVSIAGLLILM